MKKKKKRKPKKSVKESGEEFNSSNKAVNGGIVGRQFHVGAIDNKCRIHRFKVYYLIYLFCVYLPVD